MLVSEMYAAVYFLGEQGFGPNCQGQLNIFISFSLSVPLFSVGKTFKHTLY